MRIVVSVAKQTLQLLAGEELISEYAISTSRFGLGTEEGSNCTPLGNFSVAAKHGASAPAGTRFVGREPVGLWKPGDESEEDMVLTRILWLDGQEEANANTRERYIYIHGTNQEHLIGQPASHGCVRMRNVDIEELFDRVPEGTPVEIHE